MKDTFHPTVTEEISTPLSIALFGVMEVRVHGTPLAHLRSRQSLWLLALLTLRHPRPSGREWLAGTLWPNSEPSRALSNLRVALSELRSALGSERHRIISHNTTELSLDLTAAEVDVLKFDAAIANGQHQALSQAVSLYRGPLLQACFEEWVVPEREERDSNCLQALLRLAEAAVQIRDHATAMNYYRWATRLDPLADAPRRGWMEALAKSGDTNAALQVYREFRDSLRRDDPYAIPDEQTTALYNRLRVEMRVRVGAPVAIPASPSSPRTRRGYIPQSVTELLGREEERTAVASRLRNCRLVTLIGMGGIGKTRLALAVAEDCVDEYADGVWFVRLEALMESERVIQQIASLFRRQAEPNRPLQESVAEHLRDKRLLLVLDNCEHLLEATAQVVAHLLRECEGVYILATSREPLAITGERAWAVPALKVPRFEDLSGDPLALVERIGRVGSVKLFIERAQAARDAFVLNETNARWVAQICCRVEGIPLALELAAARVRVLTLEQIASRLDDELTLLTGANRAAVSRQQTMRATLDWSYTLLADAGRLLLGRLSVFTGGWTLEAAEQVCAGAGVEERDVLNLLTSLVDKSLILFEQQDFTVGRYRLLEMVRQYAAERLQAGGEAEQVRTRHRNWFLDLAEAAEPHLQGTEQASWLQQLETEHDNLRVALAFCDTQTQGAQAGLRLAGALFRFWEIRGDFNEGRAALGKTLEREGAQEATPARAKALNGSGALAYRQGDFASARSLTQESLAIHKALGDQGGYAISLNNLGNVASAQGDFAEARTLHVESLAIRREIGDRQGVAGSLNNLGIVARNLGDYGVTRASYEEALGINRATGNRSWEANNLSNLGIVAQIQGDRIAAQTHYERSLAIRREIGDRRGIANSLHSLGDVTQLHGDFTAAQSYYEQSLAIRREIGDRQGIANSLNHLGIVALNSGEYAVARARSEESLTIQREIGDRQGIANSLHSLGIVAQNQGDFAEARTLHEESLAIRREVGDRWGIATSVSSLGDVAQLQGDYIAAQAHYEGSLAIRRELGHRQGIVNSLNQLGHIAKEQDAYPIARALYAESLTIQRDIGDRLGIATALEALMALISAETLPAATPAETEEVSCKIGVRLRGAARLWGAAVALREEIGASLPPGEQEEHARTVTALRRALGEEAFSQAWGEGRSMGMTAAIALALEQNGD